MREDPAAPVPTAPTLDDPGLRDDPASYEAQHDFELGAPVTAGALVGRYLVIRQVGAGAMGIVLSAFDPQLDRRVALKLLRPRGWSSSGSNDGLIDEAKALAKLSHPNVVGVHDVGVHEGRVFVAMEFVEGRTLRAWLRQSPRPWREIVDVFVAAGRGLAAAHTRGLVHRDFKPDNVMVGVDGRARVMDFGLARPPTSLDPHSTEPGARLADTHEELASVLVGTPAYMAPEQLCGIGATMVSDQFAYCVALYEALYGVRPFPTSSVSELAAAQREGRLATPADKVDVPRWLSRVVLRGLSHDPSLRFPTMAALLHRLELGRGRRNRRAWIAAGGLAIAVAAVPASQAWDERSAQWACAAEADAARMLDPERRASIARGMQTTDAPFAADLERRIPAALDAYADTLGATAYDVCVRAESDPPAPLHASKARWCLEERGRQFDALLTALEEPSDAAVRMAPYAIADLPDTGSCSDTGALDVLPLPPTPDVRAATGPVRLELARASACAALGDHECALAVADSVLPEVVALRSSELFARAHAVRALALDALGQPREAERANTLGYESAVRAQRWAVAAATAVAQIRVVGRTSSREDEAFVWSELAHVAITRAGDDGALEARRQVELGIVHSAAGNARAAQDALISALDAKPSAAVRIRAQLELASSRRATELIGPATAALDAAVGAQESLLGAAHPDTRATRAELDAIQP